MLGQGVIAKRVMEVVKEKIKAAEADHKIESENLVDKFEKEIEKLGDQLRVEKEALVDKHVNKILGKII